MACDASRIPVPVNPLAKRKANHATVRIDAVRPWNVTLVGAKMKARSSARTKRTLASGVFEPMTVVRPCIASPTSVVEIASEWMSRRGSVNGAINQSIWRCNDEQAKQGSNTWMAKPNSILYLKKRRI
jgi:hypothetical protein